MILLCYNVPALLPKRLRHSLALGYHVPQLPAYQFSTRVLIFQTWIQKRLHAVEQCSAEADHARNTWTNVTGLFGVVICLPSSLG
jgi:hypothetical protein